MKLRLGAQLAGGFAVPIVALAFVIGAVILAASSMHNLKDDIVATAAFQAKARDAALQTAMHHLAAARSDVAYLQSRSATVPKAADDVTAIAGALGAASVDESTINAPVKRVLALASAAAETAASDFDVAIGRMQLLLLVIGGSTLAVTIFINVRMARRMTARVTRVSDALASVVHGDFAELSDALGRLAEGDLRASFRSTRERIEDPGRDEIADLVDSYNDLASGLATVGVELTMGLSTLRELIGGVAVASRTLAISSDQTSSAVNQASVAVEQIARAVDSVAGGAKDQALKIAHASAAIEELARSAEMIADGAGHQAVAIQMATSAIQLLDDGIESLSHHGNDLASSATQATQEAVGGTHAVLQTQRAMERLREVSSRAAQAMLALEQRSVQVEEIVRTIEEIADQTNLLALNA
ncbi:MAG: methyl-accepting chemotaxis protein, partial [Candidatus Eremiobacteraeota bacterium]|nr:methyl-accepting chemotaxis protein [Candidatus Eremiobacteraeota bacterium]